MKESDWQKLAGTSADPARVRQFLDLLAAAGASPQLEKFSPTKFASWLRC